MSDASEPLARLRAAAARLDDLRRPVAPGGSNGSSPASGDSDEPFLPREGGEFDPMEHAARFDDLHDALVAVLADIESTETPDRT